MFCKNRITLIGFLGKDAASVITPKPASRDHFKTGQPSHPEQHCL